VDGDHGADLLALAVDRGETDQLGVIPLTPRRAPADARAPHKSLVRLSASAASRVVTPLMRAMSAFGVTRTLSISMARPRSSSSVP
jgi:hypothetical protein